MECKPSLRLPSLLLNCMERGSGFATNFVWQTARYLCVWGGGGGGGGVLRMLSMRRCGFPWTVDVYFIY